MADRRKRIARLRARLEGAREASAAEVEAFLLACEWVRRRTTSSHRAFVKPGRRTLIVPVHGKVREHIIRSVLEANEDVE